MKNFGWILYIMKNDQFFFMKAGKIVYDISGSSKNHQDLDIEQKNYQIPGRPEKQKYFE